MMTQSPHYAPSFPRTDNDNQMTPNKAEDTSKQGPQPSHGKKGSSGQSQRPFGNNGFRQQMTNHSNEHRQNGDNRANIRQTANEPNRFVSIRNQQPYHSRQPYRNQQGYRMRRQQEQRPPSEPTVLISPYQCNKMDGIYAESFKSAKCEHVVHQLIVSALLAAVIGVYKIKYSQNKQLRNIELQDGKMMLSIISFLIVFQATILFTKIIIYCMTYHSLRFALDTAQTSKHGVSGQPAQRQGNFQSNISQRMLLAQMQVTYSQGLESGIRTNVMQKATTSIKTLVKRQAWCSYQIHQLFQLGMFGCSVYLIVALAHDRTSWDQKLVVILTIVYWLIQNYKLILCALTVVISPLIILIVVIYVCASGKSEQKQIKLPDSINPTHQQILNSGSACSICMMDFSTDNSVVILPCSDKHMFHELCIKGWMNVKSTCPICRHDLSADS